MGSQGGEPAPAPRGRRSPRPTRTAPWPPARPTANPSPGRDLCGGCGGGAGRLPVCQRVAPGGIRKRQVHSAQGLAPSPIPLSHPNPNRLFHRRMRAQIPVLSRVSRRPDPGLDAGYALRGCAAVCRFRAWGFIRNGWSACRRQGTQTEAERAFLHVSHLHSAHPNRLSPAWMDLRSG